MLRLLDSGADVMGSGGKIPLILAAAEGHADVVEMLLDHGEFLRLLLFNVANNEFFRHYPRILQLKYVLHL